MYGSTGELRQRRHIEPVEPTLVEKVVDKFDKAANVGMQLCQGVCMVIVVCGERRANPRHCLRIARARTHNAGTHRYCTATFCERCDPSTALPALTF